MWWHRSVIPVLERKVQEDLEFEANPEQINETLTQKTLESSKRILPTGARVFMGNSEAVTLEGSMPLL